MEEHDRKVFRMAEACRQFINPAWCDAYLLPHHDSLLPMVFALIGALEVHMEAEAGNEHGAAGFVVAGIVDVLKIE